MQLRRFAALAATTMVLLVCRDARAESAVPVRIDTRSAAYQDNDRTFIATSTVAAEASARGVTAGARYLIDVISSASIDVVSAATGRFHENRHETEGRLGWSNGDRTVSGGYVFSTENDWRSHLASLGASQDFLQHNLTVAVGWSGIANQVGRANDPNFERSLDVHNGTLTLTATPSAKTLLQAVATVGVAHGYQASPYRTVRVGGALGPGYAETHPDFRLRTAFALRLNRHVFDDSAVQTFARYYQDDWGVRSLTGGAELLIGFDRLTLGLHARGYGQTRAAFYRQAYEQPLIYMTSDRELSTFYDVFAGARLAWVGRPGRVVDELRAELKVDGFWFRFLDFAPLPSRAGFVANLGLGVTL